MTSLQNTASRALSPDDFIADAAHQIEPKHRPLSVVVPVLNEERNIGLLADRLTAELEGLGNPFEVIVVDDGSCDGTLAALVGLNARDPRFKAVSLSRNFGKEIAVAAGLKHATGAGVVIMDGDLQHPPETIRRFVELWDEGYDVVYGQRIDRRGSGFLEMLSARIFYRAFRQLSGTELPVGAGDFRLLDRRVVDVFNRLGERSRFNKGLFAWVGFKSIGVPFAVAARTYGQSRWPFRRLMHFAIDGIASFTTVPLKVWSYVGVLVSLAALAYAAMFLVKTLIWGVDTPGFPTLIISVLMLGGIQLISLGVIGEYLGRVYEEVKGRPLYIVADTVGLDGGDGGALAGAAPHALEPAERAKPPGEAA